MVEICEMMRPLFDAIFGSKAKQEETEAGKTYDTALKKNHSFGIAKHQ